MAIDPILYRAVKLVLADPKQTLLVTGPGLALLLVSSLMTAPGFGSMLPVPMAPDNRVVLSAFLNLAALALIVVRWHRYALMDASTTSRPNQLTLSTFGAYAIAAVQIGFVVFLTCIVILIPFFLLMNSILPNGATFARASVTQLGVVILSGWLTFRLSLLLPAAAIGAKFSMRASWAATAPLAMALLRIALFVALLSLAFDVVTAVFWSTSTLVSTVVQVMVLYIEVLLTAGVISTLYGVLAQGRRL